MPSLTIVHPGKVWPSYKPSAYVTNRLLSALLQPREWGLDELVEWVYEDLAHRLACPENVIRARLHHLRKRGHTIVCLPGYRYKLERPTC